MGRVQRALDDEACAAAHDFADELTAILAQDCYLSGRVQAVLDRHPAYRTAAAARLAKSGASPTPGDPDEPY